MAREIYLEFMALVMEFERLQRLGGQILRNFQQELEFFRRPALESDVLAKALECAPSERLATYVEAGCRDNYKDRLNVIRHAAIKGLQKHKEQACSTISDLELKVRLATSIMKDELNDHLSQAVALGSGSDSEAETNNTTNGVRKFSPSASDYATMMSVLLGQLQKDFTVQEKIVDAVGFHTPTETLENYCVMWTLRPFIDDEIFSEASKFTEYRNKALCVN